MAWHDFPHYPSLDWDYQGVDFAVIGAMNQEMANQMYADGIRFVGRYLYPSRWPNGKGISREEAQFYLNAGIRIFFYFEVDGSDALRGYDRGVQNGQVCLSECEYLDVPAGVQIYCCCDTGVVQEQLPTVMEYLRGFSEQLPQYNVGIYGGGNVMSACYDTYPNNFRVQAGAWGAEEFSPINVRQWYVNFNVQAKFDGKIRIDNILLSDAGYASWRLHNVDLCSAPTLENMWGDKLIPPTPTPSNHKMPLWFYLKLF